MTPRPIPIGTDDFREVREAGFDYIDKSDLIRQILDRAGVKVFLFPRPRRFGKTLNLSMLRCWFEKTDTNLSHLFEGLSVWQAGEKYRAHFQRYPVIHFNFKGSKGATFEATLGAIRKKIVDLYKTHRALLDGGRLDEVAARRYRQILEGTAEQTLYEGALLDLSEYLHAHHGEKVVILIDEYDEPIHAGHVNGYGAQILDFMRTFLGEGLKSNVHLHKAVVTGILRVAKENLFSGLNNLDVYTLLARQFNTCFGFTEAEVAAFAERHGRGDKMEDIRLWYNGYVFGGEVIYNPWSVCNYLQRGDETPKPYWLSTSSNDLVRELLELYAFELQPVFESLLDGGSLEVTLDENVVLSDIRRSPGALWSLLVFSGYLKAEELPPDALGTSIYKLSIPNREIRGVYSTTFRGWMEQRLRESGGNLAALTGALLSGDAETFEEELQAFVTNILSYHDPGTFRPERVYQGFLVGLLAVLEPGHQVRSNRESGSGRPDVLIRPTQPGKPGVVLELKVAKPAKKTLEQALDEGIAQLQTGSYDAELRAAGATPVHRFAVAFDGKVVRVRLVPR
ncbi:MAG: AAA family ATPase [Polyangiaceae bacterium]|nr:AAA family ATPase [Polyangiaceae bacterium]